MTKRAMIEAAALLYRVNVRKGAPVGDETAWDALATVQARIAEPKSASAKEVRSAARRMG